MPPGCAASSSSRHRADPPPAAFGLGGSAYNGDLPARRDPSKWTIEHVVPREWCRLTTLVDETVALVSVMTANNETGLLQPVHAIARAAHAVALLAAAAGRAGDRTGLVVFDATAHVAVPLGRGLAHAGRLIHDLALVHAAQGDLERAEPEFRESLAILEAALGSQDPTVRRARNDLANVERVLAEIRAGGETSLPAAPQP